MEPDSESQPCPSRNINLTTYLPLDLTIEILSRLPAKSLIRFKSVSKFWFSVIGSKDFTNSFLIKTRPRLLLAFQLFDSENNVIFSAPEHDNNENTVVARYEMTLPVSDQYNAYYMTSRPINGLFVCSTLGCSFAVCNPTTRQILKLPDINGTDIYTRLGYDPVGDQYKVLCVKHNESRQIEIQQEHFVCTVRSGQGEPKEWRKIETIQVYDYWMVPREEICIDGVIYYGIGDARIVRFYVRSEKMDLIKVPEESLISDPTEYSTLFNYNGKLAGVDYDTSKEEMRLWILVDAEKQEWSSITYALGSEWEGSLGHVMGGVHTGELMVFNPYFETTKSFPVWYLDLDKKSLRKMEIQVLDDDIIDEFRRTLHAGSYPCHVENFMLF